MINFSVKGDWSKTNSFLQRAKELFKTSDLDKYGQRGVEALRSATPKDSGKTADSWYYRIIHSKNGVRIEFLNSSSNDGIPIAILLQYGHATRGSAYVEGIDFINPAIKPIFKAITEDAWKELTNG